MTDRKVDYKVKGFNTVDGAGVSLVRVLSNQTVKEFDPLLMLDSFDTSNYDDYKAGFPTHPHRGIETITYLKHGQVTHKDSIGNEDTINDGEVQWMSAGSGIMHSEVFPEAEKVLGVQIWLNLPAKDKMTSPAYKAIKNAEIKEIEEDGIRVRLLAGEYKDNQGYKSSHLPLDFYDVEIKEGKVFDLDVKEDKSITLFTLKGEIEVGDEVIDEKTAVHLSQGDKVNFKARTDASVLFLQSDRLNEDVAWGGPIVMNTKRELFQAFTELNNGTFIKENLEI
ncbi:MAG: pirin family protein [Anaerococcus sp.]|nr:pirin family protein [Anaerococcus sp.]